MAVLYPQTVCLNKPLLQSFCWVSSHSLEKGPPYMCLVQIGMRSCVEVTWNLEELVGIAPQGIQSAGTLN